MAQLFLGEPADVVQCQCAPLLDLSSADKSLPFSVLRYIFLCRNL